MPISSLEPHTRCKRNQHLGVSQCPTKWRIPMACRVPWCSNSWTRNVSGSGRPWISSTSRAVPVSPTANVPLPLRQACMRLRCTLHMCADRDLRERNQRSILLALDRHERSAHDNFRVQVRANNQCTMIRGGQSRNAMNDAVKWLPVTGICP